MLTERKVKSAAGYDEVKFISSVINVIPRKLTMMISIKPSNIYFDFTLD
jgi:hypothetical protein